MQQCRMCILDSGMPGVTIDPVSGFCNYCRPQPHSDIEPSESDCLELDKLLTEKNQNSRYDAIFALSGGKDSVYTLYQLKFRYPNLRILSLLFHNGFISQGAIENAKRICSLVSCDFAILSLHEDIFRDGIRKAAQTKGIFPSSAITRASDICNLCMHTVKQKIIETALRENTSVIVFGFTPGQTKTPIVRLSIPMIKWNRELYSSILTRMGMEKTRDQFLIDEKYLKDNDNNFRIFIIHPLCIWGYNKENIISTCKEIGWIPPDIGDPNSTNCLLNAFAINNHVEKYGLHPYTFDLAALVRTGLMDRDEALRIVNTRPSQNLIDLVEEKITSE